GSGTARSGFRARPKPAPAVAGESGQERRSKTARPLDYLVAIACGLVNAVAWLVPETAASACFGWLGACVFIYLIRARRGFLPAYCCGVFGHCIAFSWVYSTVSVFGGFGVFPSALIFAAFAMWGGLLFLVFAFVHHNLGSLIDRFALRSPIALVVAELVSVRL